MMLMSLLVVVYLRFFSFLLDITRWDDDISALCWYSEVIFS